MNVHYDSQKCSTNKMKAVLIINVRLLMQCLDLDNCNDKRDRFFAMLLLTGYRICK
jgi:hypothetical protein